MRSLLLRTAMLFAAGMFVLQALAFAATRFSDPGVEFKSADANDDGYVSEREFCFYAAYYQPATLGGTSGSLALGKARAAFKKADVDSDQRLSPTEFTESFKNS